MKKVFADSFYWIALINLHDQWRSKALQVSNQLGDSTIVTTDEVLTEILNYFSQRGSFLREKAIRYVTAILVNQHVKVVPSRHEILLDAIAFYSLRPDKGYSLTDCISMIVMRELDIGEILTHDEHFRQEGFEILF
jgi:predicted nucleic acid-binding protein